MPQSRKRKTRRGGASARSTYSQAKKSNKRNVIIIAAIVVAFIIGIVALLFSGKRSENPGIAGELVTTASGLKYIDEVIGNGPSPLRGRTVTVHYTGMLENGTKFYSSLDSGKPDDFRIGVGAVMKGWDEGLMTMRIGGKRRLIIPPDLAYGATGRLPQIPPNSTLIFDIELINVK